MSINNPNLQPNKDTPVIIDPGTDAKKGADVKKDAPKIIFAKMTKAQAESDGLLDAFISADTDNSGDISDEELIKYNESHPENKELSETSDYSSKEPEPANNPDELQSEITEVPKEEATETQTNTSEQKIEIKPIKIDFSSIAKGLGISGTDPIKTPDFSSLTASVIFEDQMAFCSMFVKLKDELTPLVKESKDSRLIEAFEKAKSSLVKKDIANFFSEFDRYQTSNRLNKECSDFLQQYQANDQDISAQILEKSELDQFFDFLGKRFVRAGITRAEVEELAKTNQALATALQEGLFPENSNLSEEERNNYKLTNKDIINHRVRVLCDMGFNYQSFKLTLENSDKITQLKMGVSFIKAITGTGNAEQENIKGFDDYLKEWKMSKEEWNALSAEEKSGKISETFSSQIKKDLDISDRNSKLYKEIERLSKGEFNDSEKAQGYNKPIVNNGELLKLARENIMNEYLSQVISLCDSTCNEGTDDKTKAAITESLIDTLDGFCDIRQMLEAFCIKSMTEGSQEQIQTVKKVSEAETKKGVDLNSASGEMLGETVLQYGSKETIQEFAIGNSDQIEVLNEIGKNITESMPDGEKKNLLKEALAGAMIILQEEKPETIKKLDTSYLKEQIEALSAQNSTQTTTAKNKTIASANPLLQSNSASPQTNNITVSNPILSNNPILNQISELKMRSSEFYNNENTPVSAQSTQTDFNSEIDALYSQLTATTTPSEISSPPLVKLTVMCAKYEKMEDEEKVTFKNSLTRLKNSYQDMFCESYLHGNGTLRTFLKSEDLISDLDLFKHFDKKQSDLAYADKTLEVNYYKYKSEKIKENHINTDEDTLLKSHWHDIS